MITVHYRNADVKYSCHRTPHGIIIRFYCKVQAHCQKKLIMRIMFISSNANRYSLNILIIGKKKK